MTRRERRRMEATTDIHPFSRLVLLLSGPRKTPPR